MLQKIFFFIFIFLLAIFQVFFIGKIFPSYLAPNLVLLFVVFWTLKAGFEKTLKIAIFSGIILDIFYFWPIGINVLILTVVSFFVRFLGRRFLVGDFLFRFLWLSVAVSGAVILNEFLSQVIFSGWAFFQKEIPFQFHFSWQIGLEIIFHLLTFAIIYWPLQKIEALVSLYGRRINPKYYVK